MKAGATILAPALAALLLPAPAGAQPVATQDEGIRIRTGFTSAPITDKETGDRVFEQRTTFTFAYRVIPALDIGVGLPTLRIAPEVAVANPIALAIWHFMHTPVWLSLRTIIEPPVFSDSGWLLRAHFGSNIPIVGRFEFFNLGGPNVPLTRPGDAFITWETALVWRVTDRFAFGPESTLHFDEDTFEDVALGGRIRWEFQRKQRTFAVLYLSATFPNLRVQTREMNVLSYVQWYWHI